MAFDPDAYLAQGAAPAQAPAQPVRIPRSGDQTELVVPEVLRQQTAPAPAPAAPTPAFDPDAFLADETPDVSKLESAGRALAQGVSLGFSDEISAAIESAFTGKTYEQAVQEARKANKAAQEANPWTYGLAEVAGGIGTGLVTGGAGLAAKAGLSGVKAAVAIGATEGAVQGIGTAEGGFGDHLQSALVGGAAGGALAGTAAHVFAKYAGGAAGRVDDAAFIEMTGGPGKASVPPSIRDPLIDSKESVTKLLDEEGFRDVYRDPAALKAKASETTTRLASEIEADRAALHQGVQVDAQEVLGVLQDLRAGTKTAPNQKRVDSLIETIRERYAPQAARDLSRAADTEIDARDVLKAAKAVQAAHKSGGNVDKIQRLIEDVEGRWVPEAPMDDRRLLQALTEGGKSQTKTKLAVRKDAALEVAKKHGLDKAVRDPIASKEATDKAVTVVGQRISDMYDQVDGIEGLDNTLRGMDLGRVISPLDDLAREYGANPATQTEAGKVRGLIENMRKVWGKEDLPGGLQGADDMPAVPKKVLARQLRQTITEIQSRGFGAGDVLDPNASAQLQRDIATRLKGTLDDYLDEKGALGDINALNKEISVLLDLQKAADKRAAAFELKDLPPAPAKKTGKLTAAELNQLVSELPETGALGKVRASLEEVLDRHVPRQAVGPQTIPAADLDGLIKEVSDSLPQKPKIISTRDDIDFGRERKPPKIMEKARDRLRKLLDTKLPADKAQAMASKEAKKEVVNLVGGASVYRERADIGRKTGLRTIVGEQTQKTVGAMDTAAAVAATAATGNPFMAALKPISWVGRKTVGAAFKGAKSLEMKASEHLALLKKAAEAGNVTKKQYLEAIQAGVAASTALGVLNLHKHRPEWLRDFGSDK